MIGEAPAEYVEIDEKTIETIKQRRGGDASKVINLVKTIEKTAEENSDDPFLIAMADRARAVQEGFEDRQSNAADAVSSLIDDIQRNHLRIKEQVAKGMDSLSFFVFSKLEEAGISNPEDVCKKVREAFAEFPNWKQRESELRELRKQVTFAVCSEMDYVEKIAAIVDTLFANLNGNFRK